MKLFFLTGQLLESVGRKKLGHSFLKKSLKKNPDGRSLLHMFSSLKQTSFSVVAVNFFS